MKSRTKEKIGLYVLFPFLMAYMAYIKLRNKYLKSPEAFIIYASCIVSILIIIFFREITYLTNLKFVFV